MLLFAVLLSSVYVPSLLVSVSLLLSSLSSNVVTSFDCDSKRIVLSVYVVHNIVIVLVDLVVVSDSVGVVFNLLMVWVGSSGPMMIMMILVFFLLLRPSVLLHPSISLVVVFILGNRTICRSSSLSRLVWTMKILLSSHHYRVSLFIVVCHYLVDIDCSFHIIVVCRHLRRCML